MHARQWFWLISIVVIGAIIGLSFIWKNALWLFVVVGPLFLLGVYDALQSKHAILKNFPVIGHGRYMLEGIRPEIMQYFVETDTEGRPLNRIFRTLVYTRAKKVNDTTPFGTQLNLYQPGYEWMNHSIYCKQAADLEHHPRVIVGGPQCKQPYAASLLNISAMSFGSLSKNAIMALNRGAKKGGFAHNTGEGGISPYHLKHGGDLIWQIGTGYFGCRTPEGNFDPKMFESNATRPEVQMIEIKISQGAKPGHGGILPASKNTPEIAAIRGVTVGTAVHSPPSHTAFSDSDGLLRFVHQLRDLSGGKPIGFKLCIGRKDEFEAICRSMLSTGIQPDFITIDGGEGGTGAAPVEFSNSIGMPMREGLAFAHDTLTGLGLRSQIRLFASGKIISGFHMIRAFALGADACYSARAMMLAVGCIQARVCNNNECPTGVATQNAALMKGLVVEDKAERVANFHEATLHSCIEMVAAAGLSHPTEVQRHHINRRISNVDVRTYEELYPPVPEGSLV